MAALFKYLLCPLVFSTHLISISVMSIPIGDESSRAESSIEKSRVSASHGKFLRNRKPFVPSRASRRQLLETQREMVGRMLDDMAAALIKIRAMSSSPRARRHSRKKRNLLTDLIQPHLDRVISQIGNAERISTELAEEVFKILKPTIEKVISDKKAELPSLSGPAREVVQVEIQSLQSLLEGGSELLRELLG